MQLIFQVTSKKKKIKTKSRCKKCYKKLRTFKIWRVPRQIRDRRRQREMSSTPNQRHIRQKWTTWCERFNVCRHACTMSRNRRQIKKKIAPTSLLQVSSLDVKEETIAISRISQKNWKVICSESYGILLLKASTNSGSNRPIKWYDHCVLFYDIHLGFPKKRGLN